MGREFTIEELEALHDGPSLERPDSFDLDDMAAYYEEASAIADVEAEARAQHEHAQNQLLTDEGGGTAEYPW